MQDENATRIPTMDLLWEMMAHQTYLGQTQMHAPRCTRAVSRRHSRLAKISTGGRMGPSQTRETQGR